MTAPAEPGRRIAALDGLRGVAVLAVIGYHLTQPALRGMESRLPELRGGFLGVDLFFVLSGFLITGLLLHEYRQTGRLDLVEFWLRRARRLLPALVLLLAVVAVVAVTLSPMEKGTVRWDLIAGMAYVINWRFVMSGQSYFDNLFAPSPLRHLWSLAIEEQYYVLWPLALAVALILLRRARMKPALVLLLGIGTAVGGSAILLGYTYEPADPSRAYYGTDTRAHELLIGAAAAVLATRWVENPPRAVVRRRLALAALVGLVGIVLLGVLLTDRGAAYYRGGSVLFAGCAAALILGLVDGRSPITRLMEYPPLVYVGTISYGLYLWHWPMTIWLSPERLDLTGGRLAAIRLAGTLGAALLSFYLLERPVRSGVLRRFADQPRIALRSVAYCLGVLIATTAVTTYGAQDVPAYLSGQQPLGVAQPATGRNLRPIAMIGDSIVRNFAEPFQAEAARLQRASIAIGFGGCATGDLPRVHPNGKSLYGNPLDVCYKHHYKVWTAKVAELRPEIVFVHSRRDGYDLRAEGRHLRAGTPEWVAASEAEWDRTLRLLVEHGTSTMVLILPLFKTGESPRCESGRPAEAHLRRCGGEPDGYMGAGPLRAAYRRWAAKHPDRVRVVDLVPWVCPPTEHTCPRLIKGVEIRIDDGIHFTDAGKAWITPKIFEASQLLNRAQR